MPPPAAKKRKTAATGAIATGTRRTTRSQKPLLSIEMIGKVGSFANYDNGDLMSICTAVGPKDARIVRHVCLRNNMGILRRIIRKNLCAEGSGIIEEAKEEFSHWMEINSDWRLACKEEWVNDDSYSAASHEDSERYPAVRIAFIQSKLPPGWIVGLSMSRNRPYYTDSDHGQTWFCPVRINYGEYVAHLAASLPPPAQTSVSGLSAVSVAPPEMISMVTQEDDIIMANVSPAMFLNSPAVAIELGQVDILKHLVEEIGIDVNAHRWSGYTSLTKHHLLSFAAEKDKACFDYLITRQAIDVCAVEEEGGPTKLWEMYFLDEPSEAAEIFDAMISHRSFDPNKSFRLNDETQPVLPLHFACSSSIALCESEETDHLVTKTKRLLDLGADPQLATESLPSPLDFVARFFSSLGEETEEGKTCKRLIAMMEEKIAAEE